VLKGWTQSGNRPTFNVVTGVSTGALIASYAFLGPGWDGEIERFYTRVTDEQIYTKKGLAGLFQDSLYDTAPLRALVEKAASVKVIDAVAAQHARGRRLYVATTDLDGGTVVVWDMGAIASSDQPGRIETYRDVLVASAAFPGFFEPVYVRDPLEPTKTRMHVDGGVKSPILLRSFMLSGPQQKKTVHLLINGKLTRESGATEVKSSVVDISKRSLGELMRGLFYKTIYQTYVTTGNARAQFRLLYVPDDVRDIDDPLRFQRKEMQAMFDVGYQLGRNRGAWLNEPPRLEPFERVAAQ
jgi:predicted acylesterase/phospholipase RssA